MRRMLADTFASDKVEVAIAGNVLAATAFLNGIVLEEVTLPELDNPDPDYQLIVTARAVKSA